MDGSHDDVLSSIVLSDTAFSGTLLSGTLFADACSAAALHPRRPDNRGSGPAYPPAAAAR